MCDILPPKDLVENERDIVDIVCGEWSDQLYLSGVDFVPFLPVVSPLKTTFLIIGRAIQKRPSCEI